MTLQVVILAAGQGTRMKSTTAKVLHPLAGRPMIGHTLAAAAALKPQRIVLVVGRQSRAVEDVVRAEASRLGLRRSQIRFVLQRRQLGTGHAFLQAEKALTASRGEVLILSGDVPAVRAQSLRRMLRRHRAAGAQATVMTAVLEDPSGYGRMVRGPGGRRIERIVEHVDATPAERAIREVNCGLYVVDRKRAFEALRRSKRANRQGEYYLTDVVSFLHQDGGKVLGHVHGKPEEMEGVNDRRDLARAGALLRRRILERLMEQGVTVVDPACTYVEDSVKVGRDSVLHPGITLEGATRIGKGCVVRTGSRIVDSTLGSDCEILDGCLLEESSLGKRVRVGPMAHLRPGSRLLDDVRIGNFVETKKTTMGRGSKANHLTYLGDASVGPAVNIGAGTITCNYDGEHKHRTVIGEGVFIGSDSQLVAPVTVGKGAYIAAGSTITADVPAGALGVARSRQSNKLGWVENKRKMKRR
jgi:bifunctional UDP-N-acetylglucosamine pyrophosphorylase/glucosamine-1-phosphate N-acetyltransferase